MGLAHGRGHRRTEGRRGGARATACRKRSEGANGSTERSPRAPCFQGHAGQDWDRRDFLSLLGIGGLVFASGLPGCGGSPAAAAPAPVVGARGPREDFFFLQLSDTHWGYQGPADPAADVTLERAVATINASSARPAFVVFTGDLTHTTDDGGQRREPG